MAERDSFPVGSKNGLRKEGRRPLKRVDPFPRRLPLSIVFSQNERSFEEKAIVGTLSKEKALHEEKTVANI